MREFANIKDVYDQLRLEKPDGFMVYAASLEEALTFLHTISDILQVRQESIPLCAVLMDQSNTDTWKDIGRNCGFPISCADEAAAKPNLLTFYVYSHFNIENGCFCEMADCEDEERRAALMYRFAVIKIEPDRDARDFFLSTILRAYEIKGRPEVDDPTMREAVNETGLSWDSFWDMCYGDADEDLYWLVLEQVNMGLFLDKWIVREKACPCSDALRAYLTQQKRGREAVDL